jgi:hypothetical protein
MVSQKRDKARIALKDVQQAASSLYGSVPTIPGRQVLDQAGCHTWYLTRKTFQKSGEARIMFEDVE